MIRKTAVASANAPMNIAVMDGALRGEQPKLV